MCVCASTACIIVRIAVKHARCALPTPMTTNAETANPAARIVCALTNDPRLIAAAGRIAAHTAHHAGLSEKEQEDLASAMIAACGESFEGAPKKRGAAPVVKISALRFSDRIEIKVESPSGRAPAKGAGRSKSSAKREAKAEDFGVDRVQRDEKQGQRSITLVKYCGAAKSKAKA